MNDKILSLRDRILSAKDIKSEAVTIDEWDVTLEVRGMTGKQRARLLQSSMKKDGSPDLEKMYPALVILCTYDPETGERVFEDADRDGIGDKSGRAQEIIAQAAMRLSGLTEDALKDATKN